MYNLGQKAVDILRVAGMDVGRPERGREYQKLLTRYSEKAVFRKLEELTARGYIEYGTSIRGAWLTDKGREALAEAKAVDK